MILPLPISPADALARIIEPALALLPPAMTSESARIQLLATPLQESRLNARVQHGNGPAHGLYQAERGGSVAGVLGNKATARYASALCAARGVPATSYSVWMAMTGDDVLAAGFARLTLWADPHVLPAVGAAEDAWQCYLRNWRPGAWARGTEAQRAELHARWLGNYAVALATVQHGGNA